MKLFANKFTKNAVLATIFALIAAQNAFAIDLKSARNSGAVVETASGYIQAAKSSPEIEALVADVNSKRKAEYERIAKEKGQSVEAVAAIAAQEIRKNH